MTTLNVAAVLFDMDGTLVDSTAMVEAVWAQFAQANGVDPFEVIQFAHGRPSRDTVARFAADPTRIDAWIEWIHTAEAERFTEVTALPGAVAIARAMPAHAWAVVTSAIHAPASQRLAQNGFPEPPVLIGADDVTRGKPNPEGFLAAASALRVDPRDCVVFEDTEPGLEAALAAGCHAVAVGTAHVDGIAGRIRDFTGVTATSRNGRIAVTFP